MSVTMAQESLILFSIVIPTYNYAHYIGRAIESVLAQPGDDFEIVVVDDGSTDQTAMYLTGYQERLAHRFKYIYQQNRGLGAARNQGVRVAAGQYLLFLDADDALIKNIMTRLRESVRASPDDDYIVGGHVLVHTKGEVVRRRAPSIAVDGATNVRNYFNGNFATICNGSVLVRRGVFERIAFPESIRRWQDRVFYSHLFASYRGRSVDFPILTVYRHDDSLSHEVASVLEDGPKSTALLFDPERLPPELMCLEDEYVARTQMFLFRVCYSRGLHAEARRAFHRALKAKPSQALGLRSVRRYFKAFIKGWLRKGGGTPGI